MCNKRFRLCRSSQQQQRYRPSKPPTRPLTSSLCPIIMILVVGLMARSPTLASSLASLPSLVFRPSSFWRLALTLAGWG
jgi:hypothetical protein